MVSVSAKTIVRTGGQSKARRCHTWISGFLFTSIVSYAHRGKKGKSRLKLGDKQEKKVEAHEWRQDLFVRYSAKKGNLVYGRAGCAWSPEPVPKAFLVL